MCTLLQFLGVVDHDVTSMLSLKASFKLYDSMPGPSMLGYSVFFHILNSWNKHIQKDPVVSSCQLLSALPGFATHAEVACDGDVPTKAEYQFYRRPLNNIHNFQHTTIYA